MEYIIGLVGGVVLVGLLGGAYYLGSRQRRPKKVELNEEQKRRAEQLRKEYNDIMSYNVEKARGGST